MVCSSLANLLNLMVLWKRRVQRSDAEEAMVKREIFVSAGLIFVCPGKPKASSLFGAQFSERREEVLKGDSSRLHPAVDFACKRPYSHAGGVLIVCEEQL